MHLSWLDLTSFRSHAQISLRPAPGLTLIVGPNGAGKTNLLEAVGFLALRSSFRGVPSAGLVQAGAASAVLRAEIDRSGRTLLIEAEVASAGRDRMRVNHQPLGRANAEDLPTVSVFTPDDLVLVKGGPGERRTWLDDVLRQRSRADAAVVAELERVLRQRAALLRQVAPTQPGRLGDSERATLDVWDAKLAHAGSAVAVRRRELVERLSPTMTAAYQKFASASVEVRAAYVPTWPDLSPDGLAVALEAARPDELRRGVNLIGPHRDEVELTIDGLPARTHASQGEQRTLALAMRLAAHEHLADERQETPILLLDDVCSELDPERTEALLAGLPAGQVVVTSATPLEGVRPDVALVLTRQGWRS